MKKYITVLHILFGLMAFAQEKTNPHLGIIPAPASVIINSGKLDLRSISGIAAGERAGNLAVLLQNFILNNYQRTIPLTGEKEGKGLISFSGDYDGPNVEGYKLVISSDGVRITGREAGLFYGLQSLLQILQNPRPDPMILPGATVEDQPRYPYRGIMQDVGYHIFPVDFIKKQIDMMSRYKMNVYHWHLTEDHGWRIEIKKYPRLTSVGSIRAQSPINNYNDEMTGLDGTPYGGYYTQAEIRDVVAYAAERHITVIPEIELPGHSLAALAAYPELACGDNPGPFKVAEHWGIYDDVYCAGKDQTFKFLEDVLSEVIDLFPGKYIHIGGDECPKDRWKKCKYCQRRIKANKLKDEFELQSYFVRRIEKFVNSKGRAIIGWEEILEGGLAPNATVMSWRGIQAGIKAAQQNHDVVMASESHLYFDFIQGPRNQEPLAIGIGYNPLERVYGFDPTPGGLTMSQQKHILGVEAPIWTEHMETTGNVEYMLYPRLFALAEIGWTPLNRKDYTEFVADRLSIHLARLDTSNTIYRVPPPIGQKDTTMFGHTFSFTLKAPVAGAAIYYNFEGQTPGESDYRYAASLHISVPEGEMRQLKSIVVAPSGKRSIVTTTTLANKPALPAIMSKTSLTPGLRYFLIPGEHVSVSVLDTTLAKKKGIVSDIRLNKMETDPSTTLVYKGYIQLAEDDVYTFAMPASGANVIIDGMPGTPNATIYNPFDIYTYHYTEKTVSYHLKKGFHEIEIRYQSLDEGNRIRMAGSKTGYKDFKTLLYYE